MANRRNLKKDIHFLFQHILDECYTFIEYSPSIFHQSAVEIIYESNQVKEELLKRVNHPPHNGDVQAVKEHYKKIIEDMYKKNMELIEKLNELH